MPPVSQLSLKLESEVVAASREDAATTSELRLEIYPKGGVGGI